MTNILDDIFPVGSLYICVDDISPQEHFGGTWDEVAQGRVLVGFGNAGFTDYNTLGQHLGSAATCAIHGHTLSSTSGDISTVIVNGGIYNTSGSITGTTATATNTTTTTPPTTTVSSNYEYIYPNVPYAANMASRHGGGKHDTSRTFIGSWNAMGVSYSISGSHNHINYAYSHSHPIESHLHLQTSVNYSHSHGSASHLHSVQHSHNLNATGTNNLQPAVGVKIYKRVS